jgi:hypothetical protein
MEKVKKMDESLMDENEDVIASFGFLDMDENNYKVYVNFVSCFFYFSSFFSFPNLIFMLIKTNIINMLF